MQPNEFIVAFHMAGNRYVDVEVEAEAGSGSGGRG